ncbi:DUF4249 domain-containing protein [Shivajiella indica]|uniref:DUF4249 domain-containing protein n=1 Tax=Shivajiella indica TaxID=872115 RepID=A0ABW5BAG5_9BACT
MTNCIDPYAFKAAEPDGIINIEGFITTVPKAHRVRVSRADKFGPEFVGLNRGVALAKVLIKDDLGRVEILEEEGSGIYRTSVDFRAEIGRTYNLEVELREGQRYISLPETVVPVPALDSVTFQSVRKPSLERLNDEIGVQVLAHFQDPGDEQNFYFWNLLMSDFQVIGEPELNHNGPNHPTCPRCPNPLECCRICYGQEVPKPTRVITTDDIDFNGNYKRREIAYIEDDGLRFKGIYRLDMQHLSVSPSAHRYLKLVGQQLSVSGTVFDPPPANIRGNFLSLQDTQEEVLGHFIAADEIPIRLYIDGEDLEFVLRPQTLIPTDCRASFRGKTTTAPIDWNP